jgi:calcineurin-like phosphoesterase family protein
MSNKFTCADLHLGHKNIIDFTYPNSDQRFRPFESVQEHDQILIDNWNKVVGPLEFRRDSELTQHRD